MTLLTDIFNKLMIVGVLALELSPLIILVLVQRWLLKSNAGWKHSVMPVFFWNRFCDRNGCPNQSPHQ